VLGRITRQAWVIDYGGKKFCITGPLGVEWIEKNRTDI
jgi:hypothetical protein